MKELQALFPSLLTAVKQTASQPDIRSVDWTPLMENLLTVGAKLNHEFEETLFEDGKEKRRGSVAKVLNCGKSHLIFPNKFRSGTNGGSGTGCRKCHLTNSASFLFKDVRNNGTGIDVLSKQDR
jgi:hypothetical protein